MFAKTISGVSRRGARGRRRSGRRWAGRRLAKRAFRTLRRAPVAVRISVAAVLLVAVWAGVNWIVQVAHKPTEIFVPISGSLAKAPAETWREYGPLFDKYSTADIRPELLAALAQVEASWNPFELYQPASSAVGMFQITDGTFAEARRYCIHDHMVVETGCWFNALYTRVVPDHAVEMTSALLDRTVANTLARNRLPRSSLQQRQDLAAVIHLCGAGVGNEYASRGF